MNGEIGRSTPERQSDCQSQIWQGKLELPDDTGGWQTDLRLPDDSQVSFRENRSRDFSRFEEAKQIVRLTSYLRGVTELQPEKWFSLSIEERTRVCQRIENCFAEIAGRPALTVEVSAMNLTTCGSMNWDDKKITINVELLSADTAEGLRQLVKTLTHEGRHAYQMSNIELWRTEPNDEKVKAWQANWKTGYQSATIFGYPLYYMQPMEVDARTFSESVVSKLAL